MRNRAVLFALIGAFVLVQAVAPAVYTIDTVRVRAGVVIFDLGYTEVRIPPFGSVSARTHFTPLKLILGLDSIDIELLEQLAGPEKDTVISRLYQAGRAAAVRFAVRHAVVAAIGGTSGALLTGPRSGKAAGLGAIAGVVGIAALGAATYLSYDTAAFGNPRYEGILGTAPWMVTTWQQMLTGAGDLSEQLGLLGENLNRMFGQIDELAELGQPARDMTVLVVSDIHNNALVVEFISRVARTFNANLVIDAGDLTDFGLAVETALVGGLTGINLPYLLAPGNHESPDSLAALRQLPNFRILTGDVVTVNDLSVVGFADPAAGLPAAIVDSVRDLARHRRATELALAGLYPPPSIAVVHNPRIAEAAVGHVPIVITGHLHTLSITERDGTVVINPGSTGGAGIRGLTTRQEVPYSLVVLYLERESPGVYRPAAADTIQVYNLKTQFTLERVVFGPGMDRAGSGRP